MDKNNIIQSAWTNAENDNSENDSMVAYARGNTLKQWWQNNVSNEVIMAVVTSTVVPVMLYYLRPNFVLEQTNDDDDDLLLTGSVSPLRVALITALANVIVFYAPRVLAPNKE
jgi:hypothetical protein